MNMNPRKAIVGPTTILRVENISGLNAPQSLDPPAISRNPSTIMIPAIAMSIKLIRRKGI